MYIVTCLTILIEYFDKRHIAQPPYMIDENTAVARQGQRCTKSAPLSKELRKIYDGSESIWMLTHTLKEE